MTDLTEERKSDQLRVYCISDLHLEFYDDYRTLYNRIKKFIPEADVLILAGDIGYPVKTHGKSRDHIGNYLGLLKRFRQKYDHVILVPGNHEYYCATGFDRNKVTTQLQQVCKEADVILLANSTATIRGVKFYGTTLWSHAVPRIKDMMKDFDYVFPTVGQYNNEHKTCADWLTNAVKADIDDSTIRSQIVVTHHLPTTKLCIPQFKDHPCNSGFYSDVIEHIDTSKVKLWFAGHTHEFVSYIHSQTTIVVNPYGYPNEFRKTRVSSQIYIV